MNKDLHHKELLCIFIVMELYEDIHRIQSMMGVITEDNKNNVIGVIKDTAVAHKIKNMVTNLEQSSGEINKAIINLNATIKNAKEGNGAINYLSNDPKLVRKIDSTMTNIKEASSRLNENLEALKHNFFFRGYFKKLEKEKAKADKLNKTKK
jgi:phospholipid/cholesterol/gamma-HCH transport system substrate-binding protein